MFDLNTSNLISILANIFISDTYYYMIPSLRNKENGEWGDSNTIENNNPTRKRFT